MAAKIGRAPMVVDGGKEEALWLNGSDDPLAISPRAVGEAVDASSGENKSSAPRADEKASAADEEHDESDSEEL